MNPLAWVIGKIIGFPTSIIAYFALNISNFLGSVLDGFFSYKTIHRIPEEDSMLGAMITFLATLIFWAVVVIVAAPKVVSFYHFYMGT